MNNSQISQSRYHSVASNNIYGSVQEIGHAISFDDGIVLTDDTLLSVHDRAQALLRFANYNRGARGRKARLDWTMPRWHFYVDDEYKLATGSYATLSDGSAFRPFVQPAQSDLQVPESLKAAG